MQRDQQPVGSLIPLQLINLMRQFFGSHVGQDADHLVVRHGVPLAQVPGGGAQFPMGAAQLADDDLGHGGVWLGDFHRILQFLLINPHGSHLTIRIFPGPGTVDPVPMAVGCTFADDERTVLLYIGLVGSLADGKVLLIIGHSVGVIGVGVQEEGGFVEDKITDPYPVQKDLLVGHGALFAVSHGAAPPLRSREDPGFGTASPSQGPRPAHRVDPRAGKGRMPWRGKRQDRQSRTDPAGRWNWQKDPSQKKPPFPWCGGRRGPLTSRV